MANMAGLNRTIEDTDTDPMADESVELTEGQKACLRLVDHHLTSTEIGRFLGISHFTVDQRLDAARRKLNAATRKDAAKFLRLLNNVRYPSHSYTKRKTLSEGNMAQAKAQ
jgi:DNA-binding CsgD family transcriptional regulator